MTDKPDDVELAIRYIRRVGRLGDLEQILSVVNTRKLELTVRGPVGGGRSLTPAPPRRQRAVKPPVALDPRHKADPAYAAYRSAERALIVEMKARGLTKRSEVSGPIRTAFDQALSAWLAVKPKYKTCDTNPQTSVASREPSAVLPKQNEQQQSP